MDIWTKKRLEKNYFFTRNMKIKNKKNINVQNIKNLRENFREKCLQKEIVFLNK